MLTPAPSPPFFLLFLRVGVVICTDSYGVCALVFGLLNQHPVLRVNPDMTRVVFQERQVESSLWPQGLDFEH